MPELPEVETVRRGLERTIVGKTVSSVEVRVPKLFQSSQADRDAHLLGATVEQVKRRAKVLLVEFSSGWTLLVHLKMTGQLIVRDSGSKGFAGGHPEKAYEQELPHKHTHVSIEFTDGSTLHFNDLRKFGWMKLLPGSRQEAVGNSHPPTVQDFLDSLNLGPEPLGDEFTPEYFQQLLKNRSITIKQLLLEQKGIAGIGNIYADEALFRAKLRPTRKAKSLKKSERQFLYQAIIDVLELGIKHQGTSMNSYQTVEGSKGNMRKFLKVYGREGKPCLDCGLPIERIKIGQRSAHYCPNCQR